jgi:DNA-binding NarL/FixJ family response regulator
MYDLLGAERLLCASEFLTTSLTSRERVLVAALSLGFSITQIAAAWRVSVPSVSQMAKRVRVKADRYWA